jgi:hypothetical protein
MVTGIETVARQLNKPESDSIEPGVNRDRERKIGS